MNRLCNFNLVLNLLVASHCSFNCSSRLGDLNFSFDLFNNSQFRTAFNCSLCLDNLDVVLVVLIDSTGLRDSVVFLEGRDCKFRVVVCGRWSRCHIREKTICCLVVESGERL